MELEQESTQIDSEQVINELLDQNAQLRIEIANLRSVFVSEAKEFQLLQQMKNSQNIPPEAMEMLSKLDVR